MGKKSVLDFLVEIIEAKIEYVEYLLFTSNNKGVDEK